MIFNRETGKAGGSLAIRLLTSAVLITLLAMSTATARDKPGSTGSSQRYIIELEDPPLALYRGQRLSVPDRNGGERLAATSPRATGERKLNRRSRAAQAYLQFVAARHQEFVQEASVLLGRSVHIRHQYRLVTNGMAMDLGPVEAELLADSPLVKSVTPDIKHRLQTFAGPAWIGADEIWSGDSGFAEKRGEGVVVGVLDSGINWDHPSFANPSIDGYDHSNPLGTFRGLCNDPGSGAQCNNKLIGIYDFVEDDPDTEVVEENTNGWDNDPVGHGSHSASIAVGNRINTYLGDGLNVNMTGVAPRANLISYRVCYAGDPPPPEGGGCLSSDILAAIEQAVADGVDVINQSLGSPAIDPWLQGTAARAYLAAREAGIFVATSAGNEGPNAGSVGSPGNAPWVIAVGAATHNAGFGSVLQDLAGGAGTPPGDLVGASLTAGIGQTNIVHARDYGFALCGVGEAELQGSCEDNVGLSNPWDGQTPFNGEIVVCDRGIYGRVEKGKNVLLAGAGGYILANTEEQGEAIRADEHCLPATHIGEADGDQLRTWLAGGTGHRGAISGYELVENDGFADQVAAFSSRGPAEAPVSDTLKPNVIAPGVQIWAAGNEGQEYTPLSGTSFSSPHIAGAAALLRSVHPDWSVSQLVSAMETTATAELATDQGVIPATPQQSGAGRPQLGDAVNAGLFLEVDESDFIAANPASGGEPRELNLASLVDSGCAGACSFSRTLTSQVSTRSWAASPVGFPDGVEVSVNPAGFPLNNGQSRNLQVDIDLAASGIIGEWVSGRIRLSASGVPDQYLTVSVFADGGDLPAGWSITDDRNGGWAGFNLSGLVALPDLTLSSGGLVRPVSTVRTLTEDPTNDDPYDGGDGVFTVWHDLPQGALWLFAETLVSTAADLDLYVGRDDNGNGFADSFEELCSSTSEIDLEECNLYDLPPGKYWILAQNWTGTEEGGDEVTLVHAAVPASGDSDLFATGPGITAANGTFPVRVSWDNVDALPGEQLLGAVGIGSSRSTPNNVGVVPVRFNRSGIAEAETFPLMDDVTHRLALDALRKHDRLFIDIPPGTGSLTVYVNGASEAQNNGLTLDLKRLDFDDGLSNPPFATPAGDAPSLVSATGMNGVGPSISVVGVEPGRWYAQLTNSNTSPSSVEIRAVTVPQGPPLQAQRGLWQPVSRPGLAQGYEYNQGGSSRAFIWYTYDENGQPAWYISSSPVTNNNIWTADLLRFTNDGSVQQAVKVGQVSVTSLGETDQMFSYTLFGYSGSDRMQAISSVSCPVIDGSPKSYTGVWYRGMDGLGGASILVNASTQSQIHYLYDSKGLPRWLVAQDVENPEPTNSEMPMLQFSGYCAVCPDTGVSSQPVGVLGRSFDSETTGSWTLDYMFESPLSGSILRTDQIVKLTDISECP